MKRLIITLIILAILGCSENNSPKTELIVTNIGKTEFKDFWLKIDKQKLIIDSLKPGEHKKFNLQAIGNKRIDYGFTEDEELRDKMGGELFFYGNQIPNEPGILEVGLNNGLVHKLVSKQKTL